MCCRPMATTELVIILGLRLKDAVPVRSIPSIRPVPFASTSGTPPSRAIMRLWTVLALLAAFIASAQAQDALLALAKQMPKCSVCSHDPHSGLTFPV